MEELILLKEFANSLSDAATLWIPHFVAHEQKLKTPNPDQIRGLNF
jgi:hypothetical protein